MSRNLVREDINVKVYGEQEQQLVHEEKLVDGEWVYVGTYPSGSGTTPDSPVFKNGWASIASDPLRFRWLLNGNPDVRGKATGGAADTVVFTLPTKARPDNEYVIPYALVTNCVGSLTIEADGDVVWHEPCGGDGGDFEATILAKTSLVGWWRLGENPNEADLLTDAFRFANSAPGFGALPLVAYDYSSFAGFTSLFTNGQGADTIAQDDGAVMSVGSTAGNRISTPVAGNYGQYFIDREPWTMACWFVPGYRPTPQNPGPTPVFDSGLVCGVLTMDASGSFNIGVGLVWEPNFLGNDPVNNGPGLWIWRTFPPSGNRFNVGIPTAGDRVTNWWGTHGYPDNPFLLLPQVLENPITGSWPNAPWFFVVVTYDGTTLKSYVDGALTNSETSTFNMGGILGGDFEIVSARFDKGIFEYDGELLGALDEVMVWKEALTPSEVVELYEAVTR